METIKLRSFAKVNLGLSVKKKRPDGYHDIASIMHCISIYDTLTVHKANSIIISCSVPKVPVDMRNIVYKVVLALRAYLHTERLGAHIDIDKYIPVAAGLGGGSSNGAGVIVALNELYALGLSTQQMREVALKVGADIPFLIYGESAMCTGVGEKIEPLGMSFSYYVVLVKPDFGVSTQQAYAALDSRKRVHHIDFAALQNGLAHHVHDQIRCNLQNDFELVMHHRHRLIKEIKASLKHSIAAQMSGSGPAVFGLYDDEAKARADFSFVQSKYPHCYFARLKDRSIEIL